MLIMLLLVIGSWTKTLLSASSVPGKLYLFKFCKFNEGFKGIRQWQINLFTSPMIYKITPSQLITISG